MKVFGASHLVTLLTIFAAGILLASGQPRCVAQDIPIRNLNGNWVNDDPDRGGFSRVVIDGRTIHPYAVCQPSFCDWGVLQGRIYSASVRSSLPIAMVANAVNNFDEVVITVLLEPDGTLRVDSFTHFTDGSQRADYHCFSYFVRTDARQAQP